MLAQYNVAIHHQLHFYQTKLKKKTKKLTKKTLTNLNIDFAFDIFCYSFLSDDDVVQRVQASILVGKNFVAS